MNSPAGGWRKRARRLLAEPVVHFFALGVLLFVAHRLFVGAPRTVVVTPGVRAELSRRFQDANGRTPSGDELAVEVHKWEIDEALFREAWRDHLERDDPGIRAILVDKMRMRAALEVPKREPPDAELDAWLAAHRGLYQTSPRYDFEFIAIPKAEARAREQLDAFDQAIKDGKNPASLGRPVIGGNLSADELKARVEPELAGALPRLAPGGWRRIETAKSLILARVKNVDSGVPTRERLGAQLIADWKRITEKEAVDRVLQRTVLDRYRFEEQP